MRKKITDAHFRNRIFQIQRNANVSRQILDLLVAIQNAGTDIVFRMLDTFQNQKDASLIQSDIQSNINEFGELKKWAKQSIADIYSEHSKKIQKSFDRIDSFALSHRL
jgi:RNase P protein component